MSLLTARRIACFGLLTLTAAIAHAVTPVANAPVLTCQSAPVAHTKTVLSTPVTQVSPPDRAMISIVLSKTIECETNCTGSVSTDFKSNAKALT